MNSFQTLGGIGRRGELVRYGRVGSGKEEEVGCDALSGRLMMGSCIFGMGMFEADGMKPA
jgi:hypothetical protein